MDNEEEQVNSSQNNRINLSRTAIMFLAYFYFTTIIYGIVLMRNIEWTTNNVLNAIIIYLLLILVDIIVTCLCINSSLCVENSSIIESNQLEWYQRLSINEISRILVENFQIIENLYNNEIDDIENSTQYIENGTQELEKTCNNLEQIKEFKYSNDKIEEDTISIVQEYTISDIEDDIITDIEEDTTSDIQEDTISNILENKEIENNYDNIDLNESKTCLICKDEYKKIGNKIIYIKLKCNHEFCTDCIGKWCKKKNKCPLCRIDILDDKYKI